jgi:hypothetical protein
LLEGLESVTAALKGLEKLLVTFKGKIHFI